jgi:hypothetical protein
MVVVNRLQALIDNNINILLNNISIIIKSINIDIYLFFF